MARVTVEDCLESMDNRFQLVMVASKRARQLANGREAHLEWENDKPTVMALREITAGLITKDILTESDIPQQVEEGESESEDLQEKE